MTVQPLDFSTDKFKSVKVTNTLHNNHKKKSDLKTETLISENNNHARWWVCFKMAALSFNTAQDLNRH